jgi:hypothetical protein
MWTRSIRVRRDAVGAGVEKAETMNDRASIIHEVPYFSQWESRELVAAFLDGSLRARQDPRWRASGAASAEEYEFWSWQTCGVACLRMALAYWRRIVPPSVPLAMECTEAGAYVRDGDSVQGLIYAPFARYVRSRWSLQADSRPVLSIDEVVTWLCDRGLVIISVGGEIRHPHTTPARRGGHLVLAVGATPRHLLIHNPSGLPGASQQFAEVAWTDLPRFYAGRGVVIRA